MAGGMAAINPPCLPFLVLITMAACLATGTAALRIQRVGVSQMEFQEENLEHNTGWAKQLPDYQLHQAPPLTLQHPEAESHHRDDPRWRESNYLPDLHHSQYPSQHLQEEKAASHQQPKALVTPLLDSSTHSIVKNLLVCPTEIGIKLREVSSTYTMTSFVAQSMPVYKTHMSHVTVTSVTPTTITVTSLHTPSLSFMHVFTTKVISETVTVPKASVVTNTLLFTNTEVLVHTVTSTTVLTTLTTHHTTLPLTHLLTERHTITTPTTLTHTASVTATITASHTAVLTKHARLRVADVKLVTETKRLTQSFTATNTYYVQAIRAAC